jgi:ATP-binding cassette subfamily F protein 3
MGQKHRQAKDREKKLERLEETRIERPREAKRISLRISAGATSGKRVLALRHLAVGFGRPLITSDDLDLYRDEKVAVIGPNGCGKTSLLRTITADLRPISGTVEQGHGVKIAVFSQTQEGLHDERTVLETVLGRTSLTISEARGLLGAFLFSGDEVDKKTKNLSGGERSRVALALLSLMEGNLLLLDEPTNHLDLASQEILEAALLAYDGTILLVSHDRALLEAVTTQVWLVEDGILTPRSYGYAEYRRRLAEGADARPPQRFATATSANRQAASAPQRMRPDAQAVRPGQGERSATSTDSQRKQSTAHCEPRNTQAKKLDKYEQKRREEARRAVEGSIESLEAELATLERGLVEASDQGDTARIASLGARYTRAKAGLAAKLEEWGALPAPDE